MLFESQIRDIYALLPWVSTRKQKDAVRNIDIQKRRIMTPEEVKDYSRQIVARIAEMQHFKDAKTVMLYFPTNNEVDLRALVRQYADQKTFLFPAFTHGTHQMEARVYETHTPFTKGRYGIPQPQTPAYQGPIDMIITPGVSFDVRHWRMGRGGGFYDRFLRRYSDAFRVGVCYDFQLHKKVPHWLGDKRMNRVITPTQTI